MFWGQLLMLSQFEEWPKLFRNSWSPNSQEWCLCLRRKIHTYHRNWPSNFSVTFPHCLCGNFNLSDLFIFHHWTNSLDTHLAPVSLARPLSVYHRASMSSVGIMDGKGQKGNRVVLLEDKTSQPRKISFGTRLHPSLRFWTQNSKITSNAGFWCCPPFLCLQSGFDNSSSCQL